MKPTRNKNYTKLRQVVNSMDGYEYLKDGKALFTTSEFTMIVDLTATNPDKKDIAYTTLMQMRTYLINLTK